MWLVLISGGMCWRFMQGFLTWFVCWMGTWSAVVPRVSWWAPVKGWSVVWGIMGGNNKYWNVGIVRYSCGDVYCLYYVIWSGVCMTYGDCDCDICRDGTVTLICCAWTCSGDGGEKSIWHGVWYGIAVHDSVQVYLRVVSNADSPLLYVHIHHIWSNIHLGNVVLYGLIPGIENIDLLHVTWHSLLMMVWESLLVAVQLGVSWLYL